jgi:ribosomal protein L24E
MTGEGEEATTGISAVNHDGDILVFCDAPARNYSEFTISGRRIEFTDEDTDTPFSRVYGTLAVETAKRRGEVVVCFMADPPVYKRATARHGL